jgi:hypothetical protein
MRSYNWDGAQLYVHMYMKYDVFHCKFDLWVRSNN